jgi:hypothetical protein
MMQLFKRRLEDFFRTDEASRLKLLMLRNLIVNVRAGICRPCRTAKNEQNSALGHKQATEAVQSVPQSESVSIAPKSPGNIDLYLLLKKRSGKALSDTPAEDVSASGKAVQE